MSSCLGFRKSRSSDREPLLPQYEDDTVLQRELHQKLHSYQMFKAIGQGYMPSNEQLIVNLRTLLSADLLNPDHPHLSESGRRLVKFAKEWLKQFIDLLHHKNDEDQVQDLIWALSKASVSVDTANLARKASTAKARADAAAAFQSVQTVGSLLLTNSDFRRFLTDLTTVGRDVFKDAAFSVAEAAEEAGERIAPAAQDLIEVDKRPQIPAGTPHVNTDEDSPQVPKVLGDGAVKIIQDTGESAVEHFSGDTKDSLIDRLSKAVNSLRRRPDYSESVSIISTLIKRYALIYSKSMTDTAGSIQDDVYTNPELDQAVKSFWDFISSFGDKAEWAQLEECYHKTMQHQQRDPEFEHLMIESGNSIQALLTDPSFLQNADEKFDELRATVQGVGSDSSLRQDIHDLFLHLQTTTRSAFQDEDVTNLVDTSFKILQILSPTDAITNGELVQDSINVFGPMAIQAIQYIPIPRVEISVPEIDLLLENVIVEPGQTVNNSSFLPYKLKVETYNDVEIRKTHTRNIHSTTTSIVTVKLDGMSIRAKEVGYWFNLHSGIFRLHDEGIAGFELDERGLDIHVDFALGPSSLESFVTLHEVRVHIHKLTYNLRKSKFSFLAWLFKPIIRRILRKTLEKELANAIADFFHAANRELLYARERLRATRIADPKDLATFFKAVAARLVAEDDPDLYARVGIDEPGKGVFRDVYAPGSIVKVWRDEVVRADEVLEDGAFNAHGWRNEVFDVTVREVGGGLLS